MRTGKYCRSGGPSSAGIGDVRRSHAERLRSIIEILLAICAFFDRLHVSVPPMTEANKRTLRSLCPRNPATGRRKVRIFKPEIVGKHPRWRQRIHLWHPITPEAVEFLDRLGGVPMYAELAIDWIFPSSESCMAACAYLRCFLRKKCDRGYVSDPTLNVEYSNRRWARTNLVTYPDRFSKIIPNAFSMHSELRLTGEDALESAGASTLGSIRHFNHRQFWQERLHVLAPDFDRIGKMINNYVGRSAQHRQPPEPWKSFEQIGERIFAMAGETTRQFMATWRKRIRVDRCVVRLDATALLPGSDPYMSVVTTQTRQHHGQTIAT